MTADARTRENTTRYAGLDGLRALAVAVVVLHNTSSLLPGGYAGVILFFVISGFLITSLLGGEIAATGRIRLGAFYVRRAYRLFPALAEALVLLVVISWREGSTLGEIGKAVLAVAAYVANWGGILYPGAAVGGFWGPLWSLSVEEQFYLIWPVALIGLTGLLARRGATRWAPVVVLGLALVGTAWRTVLWAGGASGQRLYIGTDTRGDALLLGAALALAAPLYPGLRDRLGRAGRWLPAWLVVFGVLCVVLQVPELDVVGTVQLGPGMLVPTTVCLIVVALAVHGPTTGVAARLLASRPVVWLGERSYAVYLFHAPLAAALPRGAVGKVLVYVLTLAAAELSYRFVEQPVRRRLPAWARPVRTRA